MHRCEALVMIKTNRGGRYHPCGKPDADLHHKITRARGGLILDNAGETYHQMRLCREHHDYAHDSDTAFDGGLLIRGFVSTDVRGRPIYRGPDEYLKEKYPCP